MCIILEQAVRLSVFILAPNFQTLPFESKMDLSFFIIAAITTFAGITCSQSTNGGTCLTQTISNPIYQRFPYNVTGVINTTIALIPIPYSQARAMIPSNYDILTDAYQSLLPFFPKDTYPAIFEFEFDHEIRAGNFSIPDFSHASIYYPFIDLLGDHKTSFTWKPDTFLTADAELAIAGTLEYGEAVYPAIFDPPCDAYASESYGTFANANTNTTTHLTTIWKCLQRGFYKEIPDYFFHNVTNQPSFGNGSLCDEQVRLFGSSVPWAPKPVHGTVKIETPLLGKEMVFNGIMGIQVATPFIENNYLVCYTLKGYGGRVIEGWMTGTGIGNDS